MLRTFIFHSRGDMKNLGLFFFLNIQQNSFKVRNNPRAKIYGLPEKPSFQTDFKAPRPFYILFASGVGVYFTEYLA